MANLDGLTTDSLGQVRLLELVHGKALRVPQRDFGEEAVVVWDAALVLAHFLLKHKHYVLNKTVLELGAGTGAVGLAAATLGAKKVILTDLPRIVPLLEEGIRINQGVLPENVVEAKALTWGNEDDLQQEAIVPDLILVSDCIYYEASISPLISTLRALVAAQHCTILLSYEVRDYLESKRKVASEFFRAVGEFFLIKPFPTFQCHEEFSSEDIRVVQLSKKLK